MREFDNSRENLITISNYLLSYLEIIQMKLHWSTRASLVAQMVKNPSAM